jgi:hypothetical protein
VVDFTLEVVFQAERSSPSLALPRCRKSFRRTSDKWSCLSAYDPKQQRLYKVLMPDRADRA